MFSGGVEAFYDAVPVRPSRRRLLSKQSVLGDDVPISDLQPGSDDEPLSLLRDTPSSKDNHVGSEVVAELKAPEIGLPDCAKRALFGREEGCGESATDSNPDSDDFQKESMAIAKAAWADGANQDGQTGLIHIR